MDSQCDVSDLHREAKLNRLKHRRDKQLMLFLFPLVKKAQLKVKRSSIRTRSSWKKNLRTKKKNTERFRKSIAYRGPKLWNSLDRETQCCENYHEFKTKVDSLYRKNLGEHYSATNSSILAS